MIVNPVGFSGQQMEMVSGVISTGIEVSWFDGQNYHTDNINGSISISVPKNSLFHLGVDGLSGIVANGAELVTNLGNYGGLYAAASDFSIGR